MLTRRALLTLACAPLLAQRDVRQELLDLFGVMAAALSEPNVGAFFRPLDPAMPGYARLREHVEGLLAAAAVTSSVVLVEHAGDDNAQQATLDWTLGIRLLAEGGAAETRRGRLRVALRRLGGRWLVTRLEPAGFFALRP